MLRESMGLLMVTLELGIFTLEVCIYFPLSTNSKCIQQTLEENISRKNTEQKYF